MNERAHRGIFKVGDVLNNTYRIEEVLGRGGTSEVYRARSEISGRIVALKALRQEYSRNEDFLALMTREEDMREIRHDAIVRYYDNQRTGDGLVYLVMDYIEGPGLDSKIKEGGMSAEAVMTIARRVTEGLVAAHAKKIVHRDLSPDNIILRHGDPADAVIIDFGIAKDTNEGAETIVGNEFAGKYAYAAPEQLSGQTDARADIYALGALLLATYLGKSPDIGSNPMEVIQKKAEPLDTSEVPEPLKSLIDQMTHPDRDQRLQTAQAVLDRIEGPPPSPVDAAPLDFDDLEKTVIAPVRRTAPEPAKRAAPEPVETPPQPTPPAKKDSGGGGGLKAVLALGVVAALGAGAYFGGFVDGLIAPSYPLADPYNLLAERAEGGTPNVVGNVPSEETRDDMQALMSELGGAADLTLASGDIVDVWGDSMVSLIGMVSVLPEWRVSATGNAVTITGMTQNAAQQEQLTTLFDQGGMPQGLSGTSQIVYRPALLPAADLAPILEANADCGSLELIDAPATGYPENAQVLVLGKVADVRTRAALSDALVAAIGDRDLVLNVDVLNPTLCLIDAVLPNAPEGGFKVNLLTGSDGRENVSGRYFVGENPVIDVIIPADVTSGFLFVSALDVSGNVFHLLPNAFIEKNAISSLRDGRTGPINVRVAYPLADAEDGNKLAFTVDDSALGKTKIVVLHADEQMFDGLRPTTESAEGYIEALRNYSGLVRSLDSRLLITAKP